MPICGWQACAWTVDTPTGATVNAARATVMATLSRADAKLQWARSEGWVIGSPSVESSGISSWSVDLWVRRAYDGDYGRKSGLRHATDGRLQDTKRGAPHWGPSLCVLFESSIGYGPTWVLPLVVAGGLWLPRASTAATWNE